MKRNCGLAVLPLLVLSGMAFTSCGPSSEEIDRLVDERVAAVLTAVPTPTQIQFPTPQPTPTPVTFPPTPTPVTFPPTPTPVTFPPTPTPVTFPPTPTPVTFPPTPTPVTFPPTPTPVTFPPTPTPQPTPTLQPIVDFNTVYHQTWPSVFYIETPTGHGSGWLIETGLIVTNQHVVAGFSTATVRQSVDPPFQATVLAVDLPRDIALLRYDASSAQIHYRAAPLTLGDISTQDIAQSLLALGYSAGGVKDDGTVGSASANVGVLSQIINFGTGGLGFNLVMDAPIDPGDSGGPVLNPDGLVVGMVRAVRVQTTGGQRVVGTFFAVTVDEIRAALPALKNEQSR